MTIQSVRFTSFPQTKPPPDFAIQVVQVFRASERQISTVALKKGLESNEVLKILQPGLTDLNFQIEVSKSKSDIITRPVFYGENGVPTLNYQIDAYHTEWGCGLEVEAGRGLMGNAVYRDLIQALVMVNVKHLILAVANCYRYQSGGKEATSADYDKTIAIASALYGHSRIAMPYDLTVIGY